MTWTSRPPLSTSRSPPLYRHIRVSFFFFVFVMQSISSIGSQMATSALPYEAPFLRTSSSAPSLRSLRHPTLGRLPSTWVLWTHHGYEFCNNELVVAGIGQPGWKPAFRRGHLNRTYRDLSLPLDNHAPPIPISLQENSFHRGEWSGQVCLGHGRIEDMRPQDWLSCYPGLNKTHNLGWGVMYF